jgi:hypothetical protein
VSLILVDDAQSRILATSSGITPDNKRLARIDFTPNTSRTYRLIVSSPRQDQTGSYTLRLQRYGSKPKE